MEFVLFFLCAAGLTVILSFGRILKSIRPNHYFFKCPMCLGFWIGLILWAVNPFTELFTFEYNLLTGFLLACGNSLISWILGMLGLFLESNSHG